MSMSIPAAAAAAAAAADDASSEGAWPLAGLLHACAGHDTAGQAGLP
jgi:hypothetical protein